MLTDVYWTVKPSESISIASSYLHDEPKFAEQIDRYHKHITGYDDDAEYKALVVTLYYAHSTFTLSNTHGEVKLRRAASRLSIAGTARSRSDTLWLSQLPMNWLNGSIICIRLEQQTYNPHLSLKCRRASANRRQWNMTWSRLHPCILDTEENSNVETYAKSF